MRLRFLGKHSSPGNSPTLWGTDAGPYVNQRRAEYFCRYLLGKTEEEADMMELNREQQQNGKR